MLVNSIKWLTGQVGDGAAGGKGAGGVLFRFKIQQLRQLHFHAGDVVVEDFLREQLPLLGFPARITNAAGRAASDSDGMVTEQLKPSQREQGNEIAGMQTVRRRVKAAVKRDRRGNFLFQFRRVGAVGDEAAPFQFFQNAHAQRLNRPRAKANFNCRELWTLDFGLWTLIFARCRKC